MDKKSSENKNENAIFSSANQAFETTTQLRTSWPPPLQFEKKDDDGKEKAERPKSSLEHASAPPENPDVKNILNADISIQKKPAFTFDQLGAQAYTQGTNILLPDTFDSDKAADQKTFLHEISHAMSNQSGSPVETKTKNGVSINDDPILEKTAESEAEQMYRSMNTENIHQIIQQKSTNSIGSSAPLQRKESEDEKKINEVRSEVAEIDKLQSEYNEACREMVIVSLDDFESNGPNGVYEIRKNLKYSKLVPYLKKDIIHLVKLNVNASEKVAKKAAMKHLSSSQEKLVDVGYAASEEINAGKALLSSKNDGAGGRLGNISPYSPETYGKARSKVNKNQGILDKVSQEDPLIFIASNIGRTDLLENLQSGKSKAEKRQAIFEIMSLFHEYSSKAVQYAEKSPFEFQPILNQLLEGRISSTGYNWSTSPNLLRSIVSQGNKEEMLASLVPDIAAFILAIASGFLSCGWSAVALATSLALESKGVHNSYEEMKLSKGAANANTSADSKLLDKKISSAKKVEFFIMAGGIFLGGMIDGVEIVGKSKIALKTRYQTYVDNFDHVQLSKISKEEYYTRIGGVDGEKAYLERTKTLSKQKEDALKANKSKEEVSAIKRSPEDEQLTTDLKEILKKNKNEFASRMPSALRKAGGWKALLQDVGDDVYIRAGMEQWRSDLFSKINEKVAKKFEIPLARTGSQADAEAGLIELMKGSKSDLDTSILGNKVFEARAMIRKELCNELSCPVEKLGDYLDMSIFANTPVKAIIDTIPDSAVKKIMIQDQSRFEMATIYNLLYENAVKKGKDNTAIVLKKQMDQLKIPKEKMKLYEKMGQQDELQLVIDKAMQKAEKLQIKIKKNNDQIKTLLSSDTASQSTIKKLQTQNKDLEKQIQENYKQAMIGTTLMDISDSESFWSHAGLMEIVFKQNPDFLHLSTNSYTQAQKQVMVVHDMAQLESKLMKLTKLDADFKQIQNIDNGLLKDISKSASRLANALSINSTNASTKKQFSEISARLISNKKELSGPVSKEMFGKFKNELQVNLGEIDKLCKAQISEMADSTMISKFADKKMIGEYQAQMTKKILAEQSSRMIERFLKQIASKGEFRKPIAILTKNALAYLPNKEVDDNISSGSKSITEGNSLDAIQNLLQIGQILKENGQEIDNMKFDHLIKNLSSNFTFLKRRSASQGGLFSNSDIKRTEFVKARFRTLSRHIKNSKLSNYDKKALSKMIVQLNANLEHLIEPIDRHINTKPNSKPKPKSPVKKKYIKTSLGKGDDYPKAGEHKRKEKAEIKHLRQNTTSVRISLSLGNGKYIYIMPGEEYYVDKSYRFLEKKDN